MEDRKHSNPDDVLENAIDAVLREPIPDELPPDRVAQLRAAVQEAADRPYPLTLMEKIRNMKLTTKLAVAAAVLIAVVQLISWFVPGGGVSVAFADVAQALNEVRSATWNTTSVADIKSPEERTITFHTKAMFLAPSHERMETTTDDAKQTAITVVDGEAGRAIALVPATKTATIIDIKNFPADDSPFGKTFEGLRELAANAESGKNGKVERLGSRTIDGLAAEGFCIRQGSIEVTIWADPQTLLPIRVEETSEEPGTSVVMSDFRFNVPLDESLFSVDVPPGYNVQQSARIDASKPWAFLTQALEMAAEVNDGVFPPSLRGEQGVVAIIQRGTATLMEKHKGSPDELRKLSMDVAMNLGGFLGFINAAPPDAVHYAGKDVKLGTPDRPILWLTPPRKKGRCIVIYGDLSVKELSAEEAPKSSESEDAPGPQAKESTE